MSGLSKSRGQHYMFAHRVMPQAFFGDPSRFMDFLARDGDKFLLYYWNWVGERVKSPEDWVDADGLHGEIRQTAGDIQVALITLPEPISVTEAYFVAPAYLAPSEGEVRARYYTLEYGISILDETRYTVVGGWQGSTHMNMGPGPEPDLEAFYKIVLDILTGGGPDPRATFRPDGG
jgi:hypothetical protein